MRFVAVVAAAVLLFSGAARAVLPDEQLSDPKLETRARAIGGELRCVVCQNQTIDDSDADLARDLRIILRERLVAGDSDRQAVQFIVARYGNFVLLNPPLLPETWLLWFGPALAIVGGGIGVGVYLRRRSGGAAGAAPPLTVEENARIDDLLRREGQP